MPRLPDGDPAPESGDLPEPALATLGDGRFGVYLHVPYCSVRCGYCDFNTYTLGELGPGASMTTFADQALAELDLAARVLGDQARPVDTVFVGGGTPTLLPAADLVRCVDGIRTRFGLSPNAEVTTEANPDSVTAADLAELAAGGFTRVSIGMQSVVPHVLRTLERTHDPARVATAVAAAKAAGLATSVDLIYGTPGESLADWRASLDAAVALEPDHVSAYALIVEDGTKLAAQVRRGVVTMPDGDDEADKYELADDVLAAAGYDWYEVSNWSRTPAGRCRHNEGYWRGDAWWGVGPGAHSHVGGVRWWNVKHRGPTAPVSPRTPHRPPVARPSRRSSATTRRCCCGCACARACPSPCSTRTAARLSPASSLTGWSTAERPWRSAGWCSLDAGGSSRMPSCVAFSGCELRGHLTNWGVRAGLHHSPLFAFTAPMMCMTIAQMTAAPKVRNPTSTSISGREISMTMPAMIWTLRAFAAWLRTKGPRSRKTRYMTSAHTKPRKPLERIVAARVTPWAAMPAVRSSEGFIGAGASA